MKIVQENEIERAVNGRPSIKMPIVRNLFDTILENVSKGQMVQIEPQDLEDMFTFDRTKITSTFNTIYKYQQRLETQDEKYTSISVHLINKKIYIKNN